MRTSFVAMLGTDPVFDVRLSFFAATVVVAGLVVVAVMTAVARGVRRRAARPQPRPRVGVTVALGVASLVADAVTYTAMLSGGWLLGWLFTIDVGLLGVFVWRLGRHRLAGRAGSLAAGWKAEIRGSDR